MNKSEENELFIKGISYFGPARQWDKIIEEMGELTQAIMKARYNPSEKNMQNVHEEIVDVEIVLAQLKTGISNRHMKVHRRNKLNYLKSIVDGKLDVK